MFNFKYLDIESVWKPMIKTIFCLKKSKILDYRSIVPSSRIANEIIIQKYPTKVEYGIQK